MPAIGWTDADQRPHALHWRSPAGHPPPATVREVDDQLSVAAALRLAADGVGLLWRGDYPNARHLLQAMQRRLDARRARPGAVARAQTARPAAADAPPTPAALGALFAAERQRRAERARLLGALLVPVDADHRLPLRRAQDVGAACAAALGAVEAPYALSLRELLGMVSAHEWQRLGVPVAALGGARIHPRHGVFSPLRGEYVDLVAQAPLPAAARAAGALDLGTGSGVLAAVLARRGLQVLATDCSAAALDCAADNLARLGLADRVTLRPADLYAAAPPAPTRFGLVVCNPPWLPGEPAGPLDAAVYDPDSRMLRGFLAGLRGALVDGGEGWLLLSDLAERLGLRPATQLAEWMASAGLRVAGRHDTRPTHRRAGDRADPLHAARAAELTTLWRLALS